LGPPGYEEEMTEFGHGDEHMSAAYYASVPS
jgi:hypothetical protein